jgi:hypothetical protein
VPVGTVDKLGVAAVIELLVAEEALVWAINVPVKSKY